MAFVIKPTSVPLHRLAETITESSMTIRLDSIAGWDGNDLTSADFGTQLYAALRNSIGTELELVEVDPATITSAASSITLLRRGLKFTGDRTTEVTANKRVWVRGDTIVHLGTDMPQMFQAVIEYVHSSRVVSMADATSFTPTADTADQNIQTNTQAIGTLTANAPSGTPTDGKKLIIRIKSTNVQTFSWNAIYRGSTTVTLPAATTGASKTDYFGFVYNSADTKWDCVATAYGYT